MSRQNLIPVPVLSLVHLVYKVEARHNRLPGHRRQLLGAPFAARRGRGLVGAELGHVSLGEVSRLAPGIVLLAHDDAGQPLQELGGREHLHDSRPALCLPVGALLEVVGAQPLPVALRKVELVNQTLACRRFGQPQPASARSSHETNSIASAGIRLPIVECGLERLYLRSMKSMTAFLASSLVLRFLRWYIS